MCHEFSYLSGRVRRAVRAEPENQEDKKALAPEPVKEPVAKARIVEPA